MRGCITLWGGGGSVLMVKPEGKQQLTQPKKRRHNNVKDLNERLLAFFSLEEGSDRIETAQSQLNFCKVS